MKYSQLVEKQKGYTGFELDKKSRRALLSQFPPQFPDVIAHHITYKFGTKVKVTNMSNNKSVIVRINDRGPFIKGRDLDLSKAAFTQIAGTVAKGVVKIKYKIIE